MSQICFGVHIRHFGTYTEGNVIKPKTSVIHNMKSR